VKSSRQHRRFFRRPGFWWPVGVIVGLLVGTLVAFNVSPWPGAMIIRSVFQNNAAKVKTVMEAYAPTTGIDSVLEVNYSTLPDSQLDVFYPTGTTKPLGTIIWTHGGAWVSGNKSNDTPYFQILASHGYTVIGLNYGYGPEHQYPYAVYQLNDALAFIVSNAAEYHVDPSKIIMAGDSAGAQLTAQLAAAITNPNYVSQISPASKKEAGETFTPALSPSNLRGVILNCGIYDMAAMIASSSQSGEVEGTTAASWLTRLLTWGNNTSLWAYTGDRDLASSSALTQMSSINFVTKAFPATYISGGNADPLTNAQSVPMAAKLSSLGVSVDSLFWPADETPALPHEYQFKLDVPAAQTALERTLAFVAARFAD
jgi:acetyl esterase